MRQREGQSMYVDKVYLCPNHPGKPSARENKAGKPFIKEHPPNILRTSDNA